MAPTRGILRGTALLVLLWQTELINGYNYEADLIHYLLGNMTNYDRRIRPLLDSHEVMNVSIGFYLEEVLSLNSKMQLLTTFGWFTVTWYDEILRWDPNQFGGRKEVVLPGSAVWRPPLAIANSDRNPTLLFEGPKRITVQVQYNGFVRWVPAGRVETACQVEMKYFPYDTQVCIIEAMIWGYHAKDVYLGNIHQHVKKDKYIPSGEWDIYRNRSYPHDVIDDIGEHVREVAFKLYLRRKPQYYQFNIVIPSIVLSLLAAMVFMLSPEAGEKVSLGTAVLLAFSVFQLLIAESMPRTSDTPLLGNYLTVVMALTAVSVGTSILILTCHYRGGSSKVPFWVRSLLLGKVAWLLRVKTSPDYRQVGWAEKGDVHSKENDPKAELMGSCVSVERGYVHSSLAAESKGGGNTGLLLQGIHSSLAELVRKAKDSDKALLRGTEWAFVAKVLDRLCLVVMLAFILVLNIVFYVLEHSEEERDDSIISSH